MSGASVVVLAPNGRKQTVKCTPNTTILQIIEEVCRKQGFNSEEYDIKHHNKILDTTTTFRFSGLPNNAQLELAAALKNRTEGDIILAINLETGSRVTETFRPNDTLLMVLNKVCPENARPESHPVVIYTRREIYGKELENCTLRSLGLTGGRAMIRVLNKDPELLKQQANVSTPIPNKPVEEKPYIRKYQPLEDNTTKIVKESDDLGKKDHRVGEEVKEEDGITPQKNVKADKVDLLKLAKEKRKNEDRRIESGREKRKSLDKDERMDVDVDSLGRGNKLVQERSIEEEFVFCGERHGMIFSLESAHSVPSEDLPDDFFELTINDAKKILRDVKRKRHELENQMLKTSQLRTLEESKKQLRQLNRYKKAIIRVQFPDRTVIQGTFKPTETIQDVLQFIRGYLEDSNLDFYIYSTPPKSVLNTESRLIEEGCVPGALLYFGTNEDHEKSGLLKKDFRNMFTTNSVASLAAARIRHENTRNVPDEPEEDDFMETNDSPAVPVNFGASTSADTSSSERKIVSNAENFPKWFKPL